MADFYGTAAGFLVYHTARGTAVPTDALDDDTFVEAALLVGSEALDGRYRSGFSGTKIAGRDQVREWPRSGAIDYYGYSLGPSVPREVDEATYELALRHMNAPGSLSVDYTPGKYKSVSVEGAISVTYADFNGAADVQTQFRSVDIILSSLLRGGANSSLSGSSVRV